MENDQLVITQETEVPLPLEDISVLVLESQQVLITAAALAKLAEYGAAVVACGPNHLPAFMGFPFAGHSRLSGIHRLQIDTSLPFRKRCWQKIVQAKILNQAECLRIMGRPYADKLASLAKDVASGDKQNVESIAARGYFRLLFGEDFVRGEDDGINAALNYGYAVLRAAVARALTAFGFLLTLGIHHHSELNHFNLADDFIEPFRPVVDLMVAGFSPPPETLEKVHREYLAGVLGCDILVDGQKYSVMRAVELAAASFGSACRASDPTMLKLPVLLPISGHKYG